MILYQHMLIFYAIAGVFAAVTTFFIAKDEVSIRLLTAVLIGVTWPMSLPVVLLFALF